METWCRSNTKKEELDESLEDFHEDILMPKLCEDLILVNKILLVDSMLKGLMLIVYLMEESMRF